MVYLTRLFVPRLHTTWPEPAILFRRYPNTQQPAQVYLPGSTVMTVVTVTSKEENCSNGYVEIHLGHMNITAPNAQSQPPLLEIAFINHRHLRHHVLQHCQ